MKTTASYKSCIFFCLALLGKVALAEPPAEFNISYDARYGNWHAESERTLRFDADTGTYRLRARSKVLLLGTSLSTITETAAFQWRDNLPVPLEYRFLQEGIGARERSIQFDQLAATLSYKVGNSGQQLPVLTPVYDDLSAFMVLRQQLQSGLHDLSFDVLDKDSIKTYHYRVLDEAVLHTRLGDFASVHLERVRDENSRRTTELWLATDHDYLLLKLLQEEPNGSLIRLDVSAATLDGVPLQALSESHIDELDD